MPYLCVPDIHLIHYDNIIGIIIIPVLQLTGNHSVVFNVIFIENGFCSTISRTFTMLLVPAEPIVIWSARPASATIFWTLLPPQSGKYYQGKQNYFHKNTSPNYLANSGSILMIGNNLSVGWVSDNLVISANQYLTSLSRGNLPCL